MEYRKITIDLDLGNRIKHLEIDNEIELKEYYEMKNKIDKLEKENERLNNIINELENYFEEKYDDGYEKLYVEDILYKIKELKESDNNE